MMWVGHQREELSIRLEGKEIKQREGKNNNKPDDGVNEGGPTTQESRDHETARPVGKWEDCVKRDVRKAD